MIREERQVSDSTPQRTGCADCTADLVRNMHHPCCSEYGISGPRPNVLEATDEQDFAGHRRDPGTADNRAALRISTHALYNDRDEIDEMFKLLTKAIDATGLIQV